MNITLKKLIYVVLCVVCASAFLPARTQTRMCYYPKIKWTFCRVNGSQRYPASVPGCVHTDLLASGVISDPFYRQVEKKVQWIERLDWEYTGEFCLKKEFFPGMEKELVFSGLDTYARVFLNGAQILEADNMFRRWRVNVSENLRVGSNRIRVVFFSPVNRALKKVSSLPYILPAGNDRGPKTSVHTRKAPYHYGWDWGPRLVTCGIWRPLVMDIWQTVRLGDCLTRWHPENRHRGVLTFRLKVEAKSAGMVEVAVSCSGEKGLSKKTEIRLHKGHNDIDIPLEIINPRLWWPRGSGTQNLYTFDIELRKDRKILDRKQIITGLRTVKLCRIPDRQGSSFFFKINGRSIFVRGANWIPADSFPSRMTPERYGRLLKKCAEANFNMLRVWGGGIYEDEAFYRCCDRLGLMVWQDFMFACSMYPGDREFLDNVKREAEDNLKRLALHPSIVLWCGNNEVETGWSDWGWSKKLPHRVWKDYLKVFHQILPAACSAYAPQLPYWPSSPSSNLAGPANSPAQGDMHYWGVWHGEEPFEKYLEQYPRFLSEFGFQSFPELATIATFTEKKDRKLDSPVMRAHQKHPRGNRLIRDYMLRHFAEPEDFDSFVFLSQVVQARGMKLAVEHLRRQKPHCMGSLYWQANDCWPGPSWSGMDYFSRKKALHYYARRFYADLLASPVLTGENAEVFMINDLGFPVTGTLRVQLMDFAGNIMHSEKKTMTCPAERACMVMAFPVERRLNHLRKNQVFLFCRFESVERSCENILLFENCLDLNLKRARVTVRVEPPEEGLQKISLESDGLVPVLRINSRIDGEFSDNYFWLLPGQKKTVEFRGWPEQKTAASEDFSVTAVNTFCRRNK